MFGFLLWKGYPLSPLRGVRGPWVALLTYESSTSVRASTTAGVTASAGVTALACVAVTAVLAECNEFGECSSRDGLRGLVVDTFYELADAVQVASIADKHEGLALVVGERLEGACNDFGASLEGRVLSNLVFAVRQRFKVARVAELVAVRLASTGVVGSTHVAVFANLTACTLESVNHDKLHLSLRFTLYYREVFSWLIVKFLPKGRVSNRSVMSLL